MKTINFSHAGSLYEANIDREHGCLQLTTDDDDLGLTLRINIRGEADSTDSQKLQHVIAKSTADYFRNYTCP